LLSGLNLIPLAPGKATFTCDDLERVLARSAASRVAVEVGAISIESPVRRLRGELFEQEEMKRVAALARTKGIGLHLDGARLFLASAITGISPAEYASHFDTVYVSMWKYFNAPNGAVLAGPAKLLDGLFQVRRMFGGALWSAWPFAVVARHYADGFLGRYRSAAQVSEEFIGALRAPFRAERIPGGSHIFYVKASGVDLGRLRERLATEGIRVPDPVADLAEPTLALGVNETWNRTTGARLAQAFLRSA
jgi:threonine aldolase